jgi:hypothetical protein
MDQAQARGALPLVTRDFTSTLDSNGVPWANAISSLKLAPKTTLAQVADKLVELGMCEYEVTAGPDLAGLQPGRARRRPHHGHGASPLTFAHAVNLSEHSRRESAATPGPRCWPPARRASTSSPPRRPRRPSWAGGPRWPPTPGS